MRQNFIWIRCVISFILLLGFTLRANAQQNPMYVCDLNTNRTINLGLDVVGKALTKDGGYWDQVDPADMTTLLAHDVDNIFVLAGLPAGKYAFVYTANNNACLTAGETVEATVVILETPKDFSHIVYSCVGEKPTLDLKDIVAPELPNLDFSNIEFKNSSAGSSLVGSVLNIEDYVGTVTVDYVVNYTQEDGTTPLGICSGPAKIGIEVRRNGSSPQFTTDAVTYCKTIAPSKLNLSNLAGMTAYENATWSLADYSPSKTANLVGNSVYFDIDRGNVIPGTYIFTYSWDGTTCYANGSADLTVTIADNGLALPTNPRGGVCKSNNPYAIYNMCLEGLGLALPPSAGKWIPLTKPTSQTVDIDVADGLFEVGEAKPGIYKYKYKVNEIADICGLSGETTLMIEVGEIGSAGAYDGRVQLCGLDLENRPGTLKLSNYVSEVPLGATWEAPTGASIINDDEVSYADLNALGVGIHLFELSYTSIGCANDGSGSLYVTITNSLNVPEAVSLTYCRPDMPTEINLFQVIGADLDGTWAADASNVNTTFDITNGVFIEKANIGDGPKEYYLVFTPSGSTQCNVPDKITVTIKINDGSF